MLFRTPLTLVSSPLVSCIMPTCDRRTFVPQAIAYFLRQEYTPRELIIVDDGTDPVADLVPSDARIRYIRLNTRATVGSKRNRACEAAQGEIIAHWDDDDWHSDRRLRTQVAALMRNGTMLCGLCSPLFYNLKTSRAWQYHYPAGQQLWLAGCTLCYARPLWLSNPFDDADVGDDARFVIRCRPIAP